jgi:hypothetical protein
MWVVVRGCGEGIWYMGYGFLQNPADTEDVESRVVELDCGGVTSSNLIVLVWTYRIVWSDHSWMEASGWKDGRSRSWKTTSSDPLISAYKPVPPTSSPNPSLLYFSPSYSPRRAHALFHKLRSRATPTRAIALKLTLRYQ